MQEVVSSGFLVPAGLWAITFGIWEHFIASRMISWCVEMLKIQTSDLSMCCQVSSIGTQLNCNLVFLVYALLNLDDFSAFSLKVRKDPKIFKWQVSGKEVGVKFIH